MHHSPNIHELGWSGSFIHILSGTQWNFTRKFESQADGVFADCWVHKADVMQSKNAWSRYVELKVWEDINCFGYMWHISALSENGNNDSAYGWCEDLDSAIVTLLDKLKVVHFNRKQDAAPEGFSWLIQRSGS